MIERTITNVEHVVITEHKPEGSLAGERTEHYVKLTNGRYIVITEHDDETISVASADKFLDEFEIGYYIASLTKDGVLVYTSSGMASQDLVGGIMQKGDVSTA